MAAVVQCARLGGGGGVVACGFLVIMVYACVIALASWEPGIFSTLVVCPFGFASAVCSLRCLPLVVLEQGHLH